MVVNKRYAGAEHLRREIYEASITSSSKPRREDEKQQGYGGRWNSICEGKRGGKRRLNDGFVGRRGCLSPRPFDRDDTGVEAGETLEGGLAEVKAAGRNA
jgi:hypothetical protein